MTRVESTKNASSVVSVILDIQHLYALRVVAIFVKSLEIFALLRHDFRHTRAHNKDALTFGMSYDLIGSHQVNSDEQDFSQSLQ